MIPGGGDASTLLVQLLRGAAGPAAEDARWAALPGLARLHGVAPLLHETCATLPADVKLMLREARVDALAEAERFRAALAQVAAALDGVRFAVIKGADFAASLYPSPELRPHADIDLLVAPRDFARACALLDAAGFAHHPLTRAGPEARPGWHERTLLHPRCGRAPIDLHQAFAQPQRTRLDVEALLARSHAADALAPGARRLGSEDTALSFASNLATHELRLPLVAFCDLARLLPRCDLALLAARAQESRLARPLHLALRVLCALAPEGVLGGARFDAAAAAALARDLPLPRYARVALALVAARYDLLRRAPTRPAQLARKALLIDRPLDAGRFLAAHLLAGLRRRVAVAARHFPG